MNQSRQMAAGTASVVEDQGLYANSCGYCKSNAPTSFAYGLWAHSLSPYDYQELLDQSWRRSGMFLYRPELKNSCCAAYTIRLNVDLFRRSKEHTRAKHRMQRYLDGTYPGPDMNMTDLCIGRKRAKTAQQKCVAMDETSKLLAVEIHHAIEDCILSGDYPADIEFPNIKVARVHQPSSKSENEIHYTCSVPFSCAAEILRLGSHSGILSSERNAEDKSSAHQKLAAMLADSIVSKLQSYEKFAHVKVDSYNGHINFRAVEANSVSEMLAHTSTLQEERDSNSIKSTLMADMSLMQSDGSRKHKLEIRTKKSAFDPEEFALYKKYQMIVHHENAEEITEQSFKRFLVDTPLAFVPIPENSSHSYGFGSFHQQYLIDDRLVAVGVIDILPSCVSSNYFFWDPDFAFLSLGKYSALREIELVQELKSYYTSLKYYYLGHYIHSCPKMHYKVSYRPSELLCPVRMLWVPFDLARPLLDKQHCACLSDSLPEHTIKKQDDSCAMDPVFFNSTNFVQITGTSFNAAGYPNTNIEAVINDVLLKIEDHYLRFKNLQDWVDVPQEYLDVLIRNLERYIKIVGGRMATKMAYTIA